MRYVYSLDLTHHIVASLICVLSIPFLSFSASFSPANVSDISSSEQVLSLVSLHRTDLHPLYLYLFFFSSSGVRHGERCCQGCDLLHDASPSIRIHTAQLRVRQALLFLSHLMLSCGNSPLVLSDVVNALKAQKICRVHRAPSIIYFIIYSITRILPISPEEETLYELEQLITNTV